MSSLNKEFLEQQNDRLSFYNQDFWEVSKFLSAITIALLSAPFVVWAQDARPANWALVSAAAPALAVVVALVAHSVLKRTANAYYEAGASVVVLEGILGMHFHEGSDGIRTPLVSKRRISAAAKSVDSLADEYKGRLKGLFGASRMAVVIRLFAFCALAGLLETTTLLLRGLWGIDPMVWIL